MSHRDAIQVLITLLLHDAWFVVPLDLRYSELVFRPLIPLGCTFCMSKKIIIFGLLIMPYPVWAGDAIAVGYNFDGVWTAVTYDRSLTPKGGKYYHDAAKASAFAVRDLHRRASGDLCWTKVISQSDETGYVTVARGTRTSFAGATDVTVIGRGDSQKEADRKALWQLSKREATQNEKIVYQYFSYGAESAGRTSSTSSPPRHLARH